MATIRNQWIDPRELLESSAVVSLLDVTPLVVTPIVTDEPVGHLVENDQSLVLATGDTTPMALAEYLAQSSQLAASHGSSRTRFWSDIDNSAAVATPRVLSHRQRMFVGSAVNWGDLKLLTGTHDIGWMTPANSPTYLARDGQLVVMQEDGGTAISGITRTSDAPTAIASIGIAGYAYGDNASGYPSWAGYFEAVKGAGGAATGIEIDVRNCGVASVPTPYTAGVAPHALWVACGPGDVGASGGYGPTPTADSGAAMGVVHNSTGGNTFKFNKGVVIFANALAGVTGVDGEVPVAGAFEMGRNHEIRWYSAGPTLKARFRSSLDAADPDWLVYWAANSMLFSRVGTSQNVFVMSGVASAVNYILAGNAAAGNSPFLLANGADPDVDLTLTTRGAGLVKSGASIKARFGTAVPAGGTAGAGFLFSSVTNFGVFFGSGAPTLSAAKGSLYLRSDGTTTNDRMYVNTNGTTTWTAVTTAA